MNPDRIQLLAMEESKKEALWKRQNGRLDRRILMDHGMLYIAASGLGFTRS